jgi:hypothetical protein
MATAWLLLPHLVVQEDARRAGQAGRREQSRACFDMSGGAAPCPFGWMTDPIPILQKDTCMAVLSQHVPLLCGLLSVNLPNNQ